MTKIEAQIAEIKNRIDNLKREKRELQLQQKAEERANKPSGKRGRPSIDEDLLIRAVRLAETKPLADVALRLNIAVRTLYRHGITRKALGGYINREPTKNSRSKM